MTSRYEFAVFLSHNNADKTAVEQLARLLGDVAGLKPFLDKWHLIPGEPWQEALEVALDNSESVAVFIGPSGISPWHNEEMRTALDRAVRTRDEYRIIPVLLPGANVDSLKGFLARRTWVDFRAGLDDTEAFERLVAGIRGEAIVPGAFRLPDDPAPYRGLLQFEVEHADFFFGRDIETQQLVEKLNRNSFVAVIGASGSGKSSLIRAGLLPALVRNALLESSKWHQLIITPGSRPLRSLAEGISTFIPLEGRLQTADQLEERFSQRIDGLRTAVATLLARGRGDVQPLLLIVEQFEELFTLCQEGPDHYYSQATQFIANLADSIQHSDDHIRVLITLRADFLDRCLAFPQLRDLLQDRQFLLGSLDESALRDAIIRPAQRVGALFEKGLVGAILRDVQTQPGALPLLQHALYELWLARKGPWLTLDAYELSGGVSGALQRRAQATFEALTPEQQTIARNIFLRLTAFGEGEVDTRRKVTIDELYSVGVNKVLVDEVLQALSDPQARLIVVDNQGVEVAHEALIQQWETLREWIKIDREGLRIHRHLTNAANEWEEQRQNNDYLYRGARLAQTIEWVEKHKDELNQLENEFLNVSRSQQVSELESARKQAIQLKRRAQYLTIALFFMIVASIIAMSFWIKADSAAIQSQLNANTAQAASTHALSEESTAVALANVWATEVNIRKTSQSEANSAKETAGAEKNRAEEASLISKSRELAALSISQLDFDPEISLLLTIEALEIAHTKEAEDALRLALQASHARARIPGQHGYYQDISWSPDSKIIAVLSVNNSIDLWDVEDLHIISTILPDIGTIASISWSPDGKYLAIASRDGIFSIWEVTSNLEKGVLTGYLEAVNGISWSPNSDALVAGGCAKKIESNKCSIGRTIIWHILDNLPPSKLDYTECSGDQVFCDIQVNAVSWSPDGSSVAFIVDFGIGKDGSQVIEWKSREDPPSVIFVDSSSLYYLAWSPDNKSLAIIGFNLVYVWSNDTKRVERTTTSNPSSSISGRSVWLAWSPDGERIAFSSPDYKIRMWNIKSGEIIPLIGHLDDIASLTWSPSGSLLASSSRDGSVILWDSGQGESITTLSRGLGYSVSSLDWNPDNTTLMFKYYGLHSWNMQTKMWTDISGVKPDHVIALNPSGTKLAFDEDNSIKIIGTDNWEELYTLNGHTEPIRSMDWSSDGTFLVSASEDDTVRIWDTETGKEMKIIVPPGESKMDNSPVLVNWSPDDRFLAFSQQTGKIWIWDWLADDGYSLEGLDTPRVYDIKWSPDGSKIATATGEAILWNVATPNDFIILDIPHSNLFDGVYSICWSPDGSLLATGENNGLIKIWNVNTQGIQKFLEGHDGSVVSLDWSNDGHLLASGSNDFSARIYYINVDDLVRIANDQISWLVQTNGERVKRQFTPQERQRYLNIPLPISTLSPP